MTAAIPISMVDTQERARQVMDAAAAIDRFACKRRAPAIPGGTSRTVAVGRQLVVGTLNAPPRVLFDMQQTLAAGLLRMSAGQQQDLGSAGSSSVSSSSAESAVMAKSGEEMALFACMAALYAVHPRNSSRSTKTWGGRSEQRVNWVRTAMRSLPIRGRETWRMAP
jgi:hypothetical protein